MNALCTRNRNLSQPCMVGWTGDSFLANSYSFPAFFWPIFPTWMIFLAFCSQHFQDKQVNDIMSNQPKKTHLKMVGLHRGKYPPTLGSSSRLRQLDSPRCWNLINLGNFMAQHPWTSPFSSFNSLPNMPLSSVNQYSLKSFWRWTLNFFPVVYS